MTDELGGMITHLEGHGVRGKFDHTAVAASRIRDLLPIYADLLGGTFVNGGDNPRVGYRALQLEYPGGGRVELMEPLPGSTFFDRFFASGGGVHHLTFKVDDIERSVRLLVDAGFTATALHLDDEDWKEVFLHPKEAFGVLVQLAQAGPGFVDRLPDMTIDDVLAGRGDPGTGQPSP